MNYPRIIEALIAESLDQPEAVFIFGPRQSGKTTLLKQLMRKVGEENSLYIDIEYPEMQNIFSRGFDHILEYLKFNRHNPQQRLYVFIDEVQYLKDFAKTVKLLVDHHSDTFKLIMSGSSSAQIKNQFTDSLVGRKRVYDLYPLNFAEFLIFKAEDKLAYTILKTPSAIPLAYKTKLELYLEEYMIFGGYPKVVKAPTIKEKIEILNDIAGSCILKDIRDLFHIEKPHQLNHMVRFLAVNIGKELNYSSLSNETGLHRETVRSYLDILEACFVIHRVSPFFRNLSTELKKLTKLFFVDTGIRNVLIDNFKDLVLRMDRGELLENIVHNMLFQNLQHGQRLRFWKTKNQQEIDFVVESTDSIIGIEVKYSQVRSASFTAFINAYPNAQSHIVCYQNSSIGIPVWEAPALLSKEI